jgi:phytoene dehydrogenase-like protein
MPAFASSPTAAVARGRAGQLRPNSLCARRPLRPHAMRAAATAAAPVASGDDESGALETDESVYDVIIVGSGFGGLSCAAATTALGLKTLVLEAHYRAGGVAHGFEVKNGAGRFSFDTGPSFYCGLSATSDGGRSVNPVKLALDAVGESVPCVSYGRTGYTIDDLRQGTSIRVCEDEEETLASVGKVSGPGGAEQLRKFNAVMKDIHRNMRVPAIALRSDALAIPVIFRRWAAEMLGLLPHVGDVKRPVSDIMRRVGVTDPAVIRYLDTEAFLLSGLKTDATITAEVAFMVGERERKGAIEYPVGGARAIVDALVRGIEGAPAGRGKVALNSHVERVVVEDGRASGVVVRGRGGKPARFVRAHTVMSNASGWQTFSGPDALVGPEHLSASFVRGAADTPAVESFMHAHIAIPNDGLHPFDGHHAVVIDSSIDIATPGNTVRWTSCLLPPLAAAAGVAPDAHGIDVLSFMSSLSVR